LEEAPIASWVYDREAAGYLMNVYLLTAWKMSSTKYVGVSKRRQ
jgi:hypothetical protein